MRPEPAASPTPDRTWSRYRDNVARHLIGVSRDLESRVSRSLGEDCGFLGLRPSFGPLLSLLWNEGRPLTAIAGELAISRQACSQLANHVEAAGYLERRPNPEDRRSKVVVLTRRGRALVEEGVRIILESEAAYSDLVGPNAYRQFTSSLTSLYRGLGLPTHADPALLARAGRSVGVLPLVAVRVQRELMEATVARGHVGLKMSHGQILPLIGSGGGRIHQIARIQRVSRQAISAISQELEGLGYLRREPDPGDRRGVLLRLTDRGEALITDSVAALDVLEVPLRQILGGKRLLQLQRVARDLYRALDPEAGVFEADAESSAAASAAMDRNGTSRGSDIQQLATRLRRQLGSQDVARLAELLEPRRGRSRA